MTGTSFHGDVLYTTYAKLVELLGEPDEGSDKTQAEWLLIDERQAVVTVYDWKEYDTPKERVTEWHVGARDITTSRNAFSDIDLALLVGHF
jgi:hypothetical protein